ncbi:MAG: UDP-N-acetylmuramate:L-alanyl-gamma-D-glutamyl-meso-diaminopimelate ligase [Proteobacteria bacterium]|jgi:UDP-N-acetylmuramate: L-alanyl-gamma-D-glutamyl-meso-diaminopimelate ligase|nr:UDP-N-acetylmuramate:L-alanyl-gamma-D-glutamyl-meso-diaminopimelate ligase [Pseudomonadota bacterium]
MHLHILGICGTFMGGIAAIARANGHAVTGCDAAVYPPMSTQLMSLGIAMADGYDPAQLDTLACDADLFVVGNVVSRGNPLMEAILDRGLPFRSGPQWLHDEILGGKWVLAVAGTHGKTTTASMLAHILDTAGLAPDFLIGGIPVNFGVSARSTGSRCFVIEADEYDTAFFDKRSKFVHYMPRTLVLNNLEYDHADIFPDLASIETQFHHLLRTVPSIGKVLVRAGDAALERVLARGRWSAVERFGSGGCEWTVSDGGEVRFNGEHAGLLRLAQPGQHNRLNALAALAAAHHAGVPVAAGLAALAGFRGVRRRLELRGEADGVAVYDDFAHHPTAIASTLAALREADADRPLVAVLEPRSNTMKLGTMKDDLAASLAAADRVHCYAAGVGWDAAGALAPLGARASIHSDLDELVEAVAGEARPGDRIVVMSNGGFGGVQERLLRRLADRI